MHRYATSMHSSNTPMSSHSDDVRRHLKKGNVRDEPSGTCLHIILYTVANMFTTLVCTSVGFTSPPKMLHLGTQGTSAKNRRVAAVLSESFGVPWRARTSLAVYVHSARVSGRRSANVSDDVLLLMNYVAAYHWRLMLCGMHPCGSQFVSTQQRWRMVLYVVSFSKIS